MRAWTLSEMTRASLYAEREGNLLLVGPKLSVSRPEGLEFDHGGQAVDEQRRVRPARVPVLGHRELVNGEPVVILGIIEVKRLRPGDRAIRPGELAEGVFEDLCR